ERSCRSGGSSSRNMPQFRHWRCRRAAMVTMDVGAGANDSRISRSDHVLELTVQFELGRGHVGLDARQAVLQDRELAHALADVTALRAEGSLIGRMPAL